MSGASNTPKRPDVSERDRQQDYRESVPGTASRSETSDAPSVPLDEYLRLEQKYRDAHLMLTALVWSMPDRRATLWPPHLEVAPDLLLSRYDNPTDKSIVFWGELP